MQVEPMKHVLKAPGKMLLKLIYDEPLSNFAFNFNLRRYNVATMKECQAEDSMMSDVDKVNLGTGAVVVLLAAQLWMMRVATTAGLDTLEMDGMEARPLESQRTLLPFSAPSLFPSQLP